MTAIQGLQFVPGFRLVDGSDLNIIVDVLNGDAAGTFTGTFNGVVGGTTPAAATVTTLHATGNVTFDQDLLVTGEADLQGTINFNGTGDFIATNTGTISLNPSAIGDIDNMRIGRSTPAAGTFTNATVTGYFDSSAADALTAAGTNVGTALALTHAINNITTAAASTGVVLPTVATAGVGAVIEVYNNGANPIKVYGGGTDTIDGVAAGTGVTLTNALRCQFRAVAAGKWLSAKLGATST